MVIMGACIGVTVGMVVSLVLNLWYWRREMRKLSERDGGK